MSVADLQVTWTSGCSLRPPKLVVTVLAGFSISGGDGVRILLKGSGIKTPRTGLRAEHHFAITTDVSSQSGLAVDRLHFHSIGSLSDTMQFATLEVGAGKPATLLFSFMVEMELVPGDDVLLWLSGFSSATDVSSCIPILSEIRGVGDADGYWYTYAPIVRGTWLSGASLLKLHVNQPVSRQQVVEVVVPGPSGLSLPFEGLK